jgi:hypothetical protein
MHSTVGLLRSINILAGTWAFAGVLVAQPAQSSTYFPQRFDWQQRTPEACGLDAAKLREAVGFHKAHEPKSPQDLRLAHDFSFARERIASRLGLSSHEAARRV